MKQSQAGTRTSWAWLLCLSALLNASAGPWSEETDGFPGGFQTAAGLNQPSTQGLVFEVWSGITNTTIAALIADPRFQANNPDFVSVATAADTLTVFAADEPGDYGGRLSGLLVPEVSGSYTFFLRSDAASRFRISPNDDPANLVRIADETDCCDPFLEPETGDPATSGPVLLMAGRRYAIEVLWVAGSDGGYAQLAWRRAEETTPAASLRPIAGERLVPFVRQPVMTSGPRGPAASLGGIGRLTVTTIGEEPLFYAWSFAGQRIAGATNSTLQISPFALTNAGVYTVTITNAFGSVTGQGALFPRGALFVEAEDFNFGGGQSVTNMAIGMTGLYAGGAYSGLGTEADLEIDWNLSSPGASLYRPATGADILPQNQIADGFLRGNFEVEVNYLLAFNEPGDWANYTRQFPIPAQDYFVLGRLGPGPGPIRLRMDQVTAGAATTNQVLSELGEFRPAPGTAGGQGDHVIPLLDGSGSPALLSNWSGERTFRVTLLSGSTATLDYFVFVPVSAPPAGDFTSITRNGANLELAWDSGILESAANITGPWTPVLNATSPAVIPMTEVQRFYRLR